MRSPAAAEMRLAGSATAPPRLPTFLVIGAMKAGTTSLYSRLATHPEVFLSPVKEPNFFTDPAAWSAGVGRYARLFRAAGGAGAVGEASTSYSRAGQFPGTAGRIASLLPDVRVVYVLRDPVARMCSMHRHEVLAGREQAPLEQALFTDDRYLDASRYGRQLRDYLQHFPRRQVHVVLTEELAADPDGELTRLAGFLGIDPASWPDRSLTPRYVSADRRAETTLSRAVRRSPVVPWARRHVPERLRARALHAVTAAAAPADERLSAGAADRLRELLAPDVQELSGYLTRTFSSWGFG